VPLVEALDALSRSCANLAIAAGPDSNPWLRVVRGGDSGLHVGATVPPGRPICSQAANQGTMH
jgi:hypothetical protein